jgi:carbon monoxide dehydrogenase subunit G
LATRTFRTVLFVFAAAFAGGVVVCSTAGAAEGVAGAADSVAAAGETGWFAAGELGLLLQAVASRAMTDTSALRIRASSRVVSVLRFERSGAPSSGV